MLSDCLKYAKTCDTCQKIKGATITPAPMRSWRVGSLFSHISFDHHGPIASQQPNHPYKYILLIVDNFSMNTRFLPVIDMSAKSTCEALVTQWFIHYGVPERITSDCSAVYMSNLAQELFKMLGIQHITVSPYSASSNGRVEHLNSHFLKCVRALGTEELNKWPTFLPFIEFAQRIQHSKSLDASPYFVMYCQEARNIFDAKLLRNVITTGSKEINEQFLPRVKLMREIMANNLQNANAQTMKTQHKKSKSQSFKLGDRVYRKNHKRIKGVTQSHVNLFEGPYVIVQMDRADSVNVKLAHLYTGRVDKILTHVNQLKLVKDGRQLPEDQYNSKKNSAVQFNPTNKDTVENQQAIAQQNATAPDHNDSAAGGDTLVTDHQRNPSKADRVRTATVLSTRRYRTAGNGTKRTSVATSSESKRVMSQVKAQNQRNRLQQQQEAIHNRTMRDSDRQARIDRRETIKQAIGHTLSEPIKAADKIDARATRTNALRTKANHALPLSTQKIIQRRKFGKRIKYKVKFENDNFEWLDASKIDQTLLSLYNVKRCEQLQKRKSRKTLNINQ